MEILVLRSNDRNLDVLGTRQAPLNFCVELRSTSLALCQPHVVFVNVVFVLVSALALIWVPAWGLPPAFRQVGCEKEAVTEQLEEMDRHPLLFVLDLRAR